MRPQTRQEKRGGIAALRTLGLFALLAQLFLALACSSRIDQLRERLDDRHPKSVAPFGGLLLCGTRAGSLVLAQRAPDFDAQLAAAKGHRHRGFYVDGKAPPLNGYF